MDSWNLIINTALLGTSRKELKKEELGSDLSIAFDQICQGAESKEEAFLQSAALLYNYRQCGVQPLHNEQATLPAAEAEIKDYASFTAHRIFNDILETGVVPLMELWLRHCVQSKMIVMPEMVPLLMDAGIRYKAMQDLIAEVCGKRGEWLRQFREDWNSAVPVDAEELWETGTLAQRRSVLEEIRRSDPAKGRELLQQTWPRENAAAKTELLQAFAVNAGAEDLPWLEQLMQEKSIKVKDEVINIFKIIPSSPLIRQYWQVVQASVQLITSKGLLGLGAKTSLEIKLAPVDESIFKTGIQQLSNQSGTNDESFILYQLISYIPPHFWTEHLPLEPHKIIELFLKDARYKSLIPAFAQAAARFKDQSWMQAIIETDRNNLYADALFTLPQNMAEVYALDFFSNNEDAAEAISAIQVFTKEWSYEFAKALISFTAKSPYMYRNTFYESFIHLLPLNMVPELEKLGPAEGYQKNLWQHISEHISKLLSLKSQTIKAFNE